MNKKRCTWCEGQFDAYVKYHDEEWGVPVHDDMTHFEFLILEGAQAGLSWSTVLKKRSGYKKWFRNFNPEAVALIDKVEKAKILETPEVIRNKLKVESAINNAQRFLEVQSEFGSFDSYIWRFVDGQVIHGHWKSMQEVPAKTDVSDALSKDLIQRGFKFVGSTIMYAHLQATGLVNDHTTDCFRYRDLYPSKRLNNQFLRDADTPNSNEFPFFESG